ncbi:MAG: TonB-dependent receptor [Lutibacter sp.]|nr:TonB-dependent receptor [Lutibacter sp.]
MNIKVLLKKALKWSLAIFIFLGVFLGNEIIAQNGTTINGTITEASGQSLPGVNVLEKGTKNGTSTDFDGKFTIKVSNTNAILVFSYVGFETHEVNLAGKNKIDVVLKAELESLDEVVVVGYGTVKKSDLTGSVSSLSAATVTERNVTNPLEAIQGNIAGVQISSSTGRIGDGFDVTIRGSNSLNGSSPLFIVDGVPTDGIDFLNPQDIARIDVLKDASSAAIYGSRGASGVIIVTTKSGITAKSGITVSFDSSYGVKEVARLPIMMDGEKWWYYHESAFLATINLNNPMAITRAQIESNVISTHSPLLKRRAAENNTFDWYDAVLKSGIQQNNYLSISGSSENGMSYNLGLGLQKETGNIEKESLDKYTFKAGLNHKINDKFSTGVNITVAMTDEQLGSADAMQEAFRLNPFLSPWAVDLDGNEIIGQLYLQPGKLRNANNVSQIDKTSTINPLLEIANSSDEIRRWKTVGNLYLEYKPLDWLSFKSTYSAGVEDYRRGKAWGALTNLGLSNKNLPLAEISKSESFNYTWDNQFNINYSFNKDHVLSFLGLQSLYSNRYESSFLSSKNQPFDTRFYNIGSGAQSTYNVGSAFAKNTLSSYAMRVNYAFRDKYLLTASNRWDGSSVLSAGNKWASFPSIALAWKVKEELFMQNNNFISDLKTRVSIGYTGNDTVDPYSTLNALTQQTYYDYNNTAANGWLAGALANSDLTWEKTRELNFGIDFGFLNNRISGSVDVYDRLSDDLIFAQTLAKESGWATTFANVGSVSNKGVEVLLTTRNIKTENVSWETTFTFTKNSNKLVSLYNQNKVDDIGNNLFIGENINSIYNYVFDGIWQASEKDLAASFNQKEGQARVKDLNGDGKIDANNDRTILGNRDPDWSGSITSKLVVKDFDLSISAITNQGVLVLSNFHDNFSDVNDRGRQKLDLADWYIPANGAGIPAQASNTNPQSRNEGAYWASNMAFYRDASFVKIKNIALGYTFNKNTLHKLKVKSFRIYGNVLNPFVITKYDGYDPEWAGAPLGLGRTSSVTYQLGLSLKL